MTVSRVTAFFLLGSCVLIHARQSSGAPAKNSLDWFSQASERMTLRVAGTAPFHLHAVFKASPGEEMLGPGQKPSIITGDGTYDEVWLGLHQWRREVSFAGYQATEIDSGGARRMQASSDYVPARVTMLLDALLTPIPRNLTSKELKDGANWKIDSVNSRDLSLVRLSKSTGSQRTDYTDSFYFFPASGVAAMSNYNGMVTIWSNDVTFSNKAVPHEVTIKAGERELLAARIAIEPAGEPDPGTFAIDGPPAEPGMTLRPLHPSDVRMHETEGSLGSMDTELGPAAAYSLVGTLDRHGRYRELEVILAPSPRDASRMMKRIRETHFGIATIDRSPCQVRMIWLVM